MSIFILLVRELRHVEVKLLVKVHTSRGEAGIQAQSVHVQTPWSQRTASLITKLTFESTMV